MKRRSLVGALSAAAWVPGWSAATDSRPLQRLSPLPPEFFGLIVHRAHTTTRWPAVPFRSWMLWDSYLKWSDLEPEPGRWRWDNFDRQMALAQQHGVEVAYTLGQTPTWASVEPLRKHAYGLGSGAMPTDLSLYARHVDAVASRYRGRIAAYQVWNEPKLRRDGECKGVVFLCASVGDLVDLTRTAHAALRRADPAAKLFSPAFTGGLGGVETLDKYLSAGAGKWLDGVGFHFYEARPEEVSKVLAAMRRVLARHGLERLPIWNTEVGYLIQNDEGNVQREHDAGPFSLVLTPQQAAGYVVRMLAVCAAGGMERVHWYAWDNGHMGLSRTRTGEPNAAGLAYAQAAKWLVGCSMDCEQREDDLWVCRLQRRGREASLMWRPSGRPLPAWASAGWVEFLQGQRSRVARGDVAPDDGLPALVVGDTQPW